MTWGFDPRAVQRKLAAGSWYQGAIDGLWGRKSMIALLSCVSRSGRGEESFLADAMLIELPKAEIVTPLRIAHFLAQGAVETTGFRDLQENLNYKASRIKAVWPSRFPTTAAAQPFAYKPEALANRVYGGRLGNGAEATGDGWRYRGRGLFMLTGKGNYHDREVETGLPLVAKPDIAANPAISVKLAALYWQSRRIQRRADADDLIGVRRLVNGGTHGLDDTKVYLGRAKAVLL